jgi:hypothetical protein
MMDGNKESRRTYDAMSILLLTILAGGAVGFGAVLVAYDHFSIAGIAMFGGVGVAFLLVGFPTHHRPPANTQVHGTARPASEQETKAAAIGSTKINDLHDRTFSD